MTSSGALDLPHPLLSPVGHRWKARKRVHRSMTKIKSLCTGMEADNNRTSSSGSSSCDPMILGGKFVLVPAANPERICIFDFPSLHPQQQQEQQQVLPSSVVILGETLGSVVFIEGDNSSNEIIAVSDDAQCYLIEIGEKLSRIVHTWNTTNFGTIACASFVNNQVFLGYLNGHLECWELMKSQNNSRVVSKLSWRGNFQINNAVHGVSPLRIEISQLESSASRHSYMVVVLSPVKNVVNSELVEVIRVDSLVDAWKSRGARSVLDLKKHCVLPEMGMEIMDSSNQKPKLIPIKGFACTW